MSDFARQASPAFNDRLRGELAAITRDVSAVVGRALEALVLGGGYGRGEGGVVRVDGVEQPYNDLDLFLFVRPWARVDGQRLARVLAPHANRLGIHVDVSRPVRLDEVPRWPPALMWLDLLEGHAVLSGPRDVLTSRAPAWTGRPLPAVEATRLMLNRGAGLLWAMRVQRGIEPPPDPEFVRRNAYKAALALGDALLILHGRYRSRCEGRDALLVALAAERAEVRELDVAAWHREALAFKFRPDQAPRQAWTVTDLEAVCRAFVRVFLAVEAARHGRTFADAKAYGAWDGDREAGEAGVPGCLGNLLRNLRRGHPSLRSPRDRLYRALPGLVDPVSFDAADWPATSGRWLEDWRATQ